jgi:hypothetical protein
MGVQRSLLQAIDPKRFISSNLLQAIYLKENTGFMILENHQDKGGGGQR